MKNDSKAYETKVKPTADSVPRGILLLGCFNSPDIFAPAIIPVKKIEMEEILQS